MEIWKCFHDGLNELFTYNVGIDRAT